MSVAQNALAKRENRLRGLRSIVRKLGLIASSDLSNRDKLRYVLNAAGHGAGLLTYRLRGDASIALRKGTTDSKVFDEIFVERAYGPCLAALPADLGRVTVIDLGANIGLSALFLARALKVEKIIAVEPDPDNFELLSENLRRSGLESCSTAVHAFAGADHGFAELQDSGNGAWGMRMGPRSACGTLVLPLAEIAGIAKAGATVVLKCDIEGAERQLFQRIRDWEHLIHYIFLELHTEFLPVGAMFACLESSGYQWTVHGDPPASTSIALMLLERGDRRNSPA
jgi:FkbM family methyltransferase